MRDWALRFLGNGVPLAVAPDDIQAFDDEEVQVPIQSKVLAHLDNEELAEVSRAVAHDFVVRQVDASGGKVVVLQGAEEFDGAEMVKALADALGEETLLISLSPDDDLDTLDEDGMAEAGWLKTSKVQGFLDFAIREWRRKRDEADQRDNSVFREQATHYVDALQSVRVSILGKLLP